MFGATLIGTVKSMASVIIFFFVYSFIYKVNWVLNFEYVIIQTFFQQRGESVTSQKTFFDRDGYLHCQTMEEKYRLTFCS